MYFDQLHWICIRSIGRKLFTDLLLNRFWDNCVGAISKLQKSKMVIIDF